MINSFYEIFGICFHPGGSKFQILLSTSRSLEPPSSLRRSCPRGEGDCVDGEVEVYEHFIAERCPGRTLTVRPITQFIQTLNRDGLRTYPCRIPVGTGKILDVPSPYLTTLFVSV